MKDDIIADLEDRIESLEELNFKLIEKGEYLIEAIEGEGYYCEFEDAIEDLRKVINS